MGAGARAGGGRGPLRGPEARGRPPLPAAAVAGGAVHAPGWRHRAGPWVLRPPWCRRPTRSGGFVRVPAAGGVFLSPGADGGAGWRPGLLPKFPAVPGTAPHAPAPKVSAAGGGWSGPAKWPAARRDRAAPGLQPPPARQQLHVHPGACLQVGAARAAVHPRGFCSPRPGAARSRSRLGSAWNFRHQLSSSTSSKNTLRACNARETRPEGSLEPDLTACRRRLPSALSNMSAWFFGDDSPRGRVP